MLQDIVAFSVCLDGANYSPPQHQNIQYNSIVTNVGGGYVTQRHEFVAGDAGTYAFSASIHATESRGCVIAITKNNQDVAKIWASHSVDAMGSNMIIIELQMGDAVAVKNISDNCRLNGVKFNFFTGFKII